MPLVFAALLTIPPPTAEDRALAYLTREVPAWSAANHCFSCHNNGNAARALYAALRAGRTVPPAALADTTRWLSKPSSWGHNGGDEAFNDKDLARLQFTLALREAVESGHVRDRQPLADAAAAIADRQRPDGSWAAGTDGNLGSATTLGTTLATAEARCLLEHTDATRFAAAIRRADDWLNHKSVRSVTDAAAVLLALSSEAGGAVAARRGQCFSIVRRGESKGGGWGPYVNSSPEAFDTALVVLALSGQPTHEETRAWVRRGRAYLERTQRPDGSWPETTRPAGAESYAERLSTAGWATRALLATK